MSKFTLAIGLAAVCIQLVSCDLPAECKAMIKKANPFVCCNIPSIVKKEDLESCHINLEEGPDESPEDRKKCDKEMCLAKSMNMLTSDGKVDKEAVRSAIDGVVQADASFSEWAADVKDSCIDGEFGGPAPPDMCEPKKFLHCFGFHNLKKCPKWVDNEACNTLRENMDKCMPPHH